MEPAKNGSPTRGLTGQLIWPLARNPNNQIVKHLRADARGREGFRESDFPSACTKTRNSSRPLPPLREGLCPDIPFVRTFYCHSQYVVIKILQDFLEHSPGAFRTPESTNEHGMPLGSSQGRFTFILDIGKQTAEDAPRIFRGEKSPRTSIEGGRMRGKVIPPPG